MSVEYDGVDIEQLKFDIDAIKSMVSITDVVQSHFQTETRSQRLYISCLSHDDTKPSMQVNEHGRNGGYCFCYSCKAHFDCIGLLKESMNISFKEACYTLCREYGISLERVTNIQEMKAKLHIGEGKTTKWEDFPLSDEDCMLIGIEKDYSQNAIDRVWQKDKEATEKNLAELYETAKEEVCGYIEIAKERFFSLYGLHSPKDWDEAKKIEEIMATHNNGAYKNLHLQPKENVLMSDYRELQKLACEVNGLQEQIKRLDSAEAKLTRAQHVGKLARENSEAQIDKSWTEEADKENDREERE